MKTKPIGIALPAEQQSVDTLIEFAHEVSRVVDDLDWSDRKLVWLALRSRAVLLACERDGLVMIEG